jgi:hypothetical protein
MEAVDSEANDEASVAAMDDVEMVCLPDDVCAEISSAFLIKWWRKKLVKLTLLAVRRRKRKGPGVQCWLRRESQEDRKMGEQCLKRPKTEKEDQSRDNPRYLS